MNAEESEKYQKLSEQYAEGERLMTEASEGLKELGVHAATPAQLRKQNAEYLARLAAIVRSDEATDEIRELIGGPVPFRDVTVA